MANIVRDVFEILRIAGARGAAMLLARSNRLRESARPFIAVNALIALEKHDLNRALLSEAGLELSARTDLDPSSLSAICEYLYEIGVLERPRPGVFRARKRRRFEAVLDAVHGCHAYQAPIQELARLLSGEFAYGRDVARDDRYDAIASATLTSVFSYGFSHAVLRRSGASSLMDLGCGTGEYLAFLGSRGLPGPLYGVDLSEEAIAEGKRRGFESERVRLVAGDLFDLEKLAVEARVPRVDVVSFMFVLHEFEDAQVQAILASVRRAQPTARILLTELADRPSDEIAATRRTVFPELKFVHRLSRQVLRTPARWTELFSLAGYRVALVAENGLTNHVCLCFAAN